MSGTQTQKYTKRHADELEKFVGNVIATESKGGIVLDSVVARDAAMGALKNASGQQPQVLTELLGKASTEDEDRIVKAVFDGVNAFQREHGFIPSGDLLLSALHQGHSVFDSVTNGHHDQISINPAAPMIAIMGAMAEATPFAGYLPADNGSNEARLIVVQHQAGSAWGDYAIADSLDGIASGGAYLGSGRTMELSAPNDTLAYTFAFKAQAAAGAAMKLLRGRTIVYVNGERAATEISNGSSVATSVPIAGGIKINTTDYTLSGTVNPGTGTVSVTPTPALPGGTVVTVEAFTDFEADPSVTPRIGVQAASYQLFASPFRAVYQITPEARSQFSNEIGIDAGAEAMLTIRAQFATERHYDALKKVKMIGKYINAEGFDFGYANQILQKSRSQIWQDFSAVLGVTSQKMAELTSDHGITHLYVGKHVASQFLGMPRDLFEPSGITDRPGIFRLGRLFGKYEVYYAPKVVVENAGGTTAEIICVGRSTQTARCPIIMGDASAPMFRELGIGTDLQGGYGFDARVFTATNPHAISAKGCALITVTNLK